MWWDRAAQRLLTFALHIGTMTPKPKVHSRFTVTSGCLCYGHLHNIWHGKSTPIQPFPTSLERIPGGTVHSQDLHFNIAAQNGTWLAHQLIDKNTNQVAGWFVCHSDVDAESEADKILRVSGSPYEFDSGSMFLHETTVAEGVLPINRYDWGRYVREDDVRAHTRDTNEGAGSFEQVGLVDYGHAEAYVEKWKGMTPRDREAKNQPHGVWMTTKGGYMFGRFGFDDEHMAARSFLWFTADTYFTRTTFVGMERTLKIYETREAVFQRKLREDFNFDGLEMIHRLSSWNGLASQIIPKPTCLGAYDPDEYILQAPDVDAIRIAREVKVPDFPAQWKAASVAVLNNILMSYLEKFIAPVSSAHDTIASAAASMFPRHKTPKTIDQYMYGFMMRLNLQSIKGYNRAAVSAG